MSDPTEDQIREQAHALWEKEGSPQGRDTEFWERARLLLETKAAPAPVTSTPAKGDREVEIAAVESFPASDPPAYTADQSIRTR